MPKTGDYNAPVIGFIGVVVTVALVLAISNKFGPSDKFSSTSLSASLPNRISVGSGKGVLLPLAHTAYEDGQSFVEKFLNKYGFAGTETVEYTPDDTTWHHKWAYAKVYGNNDCESPLYAIGGIATNRCLDINSTGIVISCTDEAIMASKYESGDCSGSPEETVRLADKDTCVAADDIFSVNFNISLLFSCSESTDLPLATGHYDVFRALYNRTGDISTCDDSDLVTVFEASPTNQCISVDDTDGGEDFSVEFGHDGKFPYLSIYNGTSSCEGSPTEDVSLTTNCAEAEVLDDEIRYFWEYQKVSE